MVAIKTIVMMNILRSVLLVACSVIFTITHADTSKATAINFPVDTGWGEPIFNQYTSTNKTNEWRYARKNATLIITRTECEKCTPITQQDVDEYNNQKNQATTTESALLINHKNTPAMLRLYASHKNVNLRVFQIYINGFYYEIQLGVKKSATHDFSFKLESEFMKMVNGFAP